jgi:hypothetical protein
MKQRQRAAPEYTTDADGQRLVHVALANSQQRATLYAEDYQRLMAAGFSTHWQYTEDGRGGAYVTLSAYTSTGHNRLIPVARLITNAGHGERVRASDGNTLNLRSDNLAFYAGRAWFNASDWYPTADSARAAGVIVNKRDRPTPAPHHGSAATATKARREPSRQPVHHAEPIDTPQASSESAATYTPHTVDVAALGQRVRQQLAAKALEVAA